MNTRVAGAGLFLVLAAFSGQSQNSIAHPDPGETVLGVTIAGVSRDRIDLYGAEYAPMPVLSELAAEGVIYEALVPSSVGANASLASLFTGLAPTVHGVGSMRTLGGARLADDFMIVAEEVQREGWRTELVGAALGVVAFVFEGRPYETGTPCRYAGQCSSHHLRVNLHRRPAACRSTR